MGHAGAIISGSSGTAQAKKEALEAAGIRVGTTPTEVAEPRGRAAPSIERLDSSRGIDLLPARGVPAPECLPEEELADCARTVLERDGKTILSYGSGAGYAPLRELLGEWFKVAPGQIILTNGALQGFVLLAQHFGRGQTVFVEDPTYDRPLKILRENAMTAVPMAMDDDGLLPGAVSRRHSTTHGKPAFIYYDPDLPEPERAVPCRRIAAERSSATPRRPVR